MKFIYIFTSSSFHFATNIAENVFPKKIFIIFMDCILI